MEGLLLYSRMWLLELVLAMGIPVLDSGGVHGGALSQD